MIETPARVRREDGEVAWVVSEAPASCGACGGKGCGSSVFARFWHADQAEFPVANPIGARPGDAVVVGLPEGVLLRAASASYVMPLLLLLLGAGGVHALYGEPASILGGLCGLVLAAAWLRRRAAPARGPVILRRDTGGGCQRG